jgi:diadenosine tetraphosphatase ApaH/serine/threonine PP2A family protein phosphatase
VLALLYDIHGNLPALDAVLDDARAAGADRFVLGGDYALFGAWPAETLARLERLPGATWIRGNGERWTAAPAQAPQVEPVQAAARWCAQALGAAAVARLADLPASAVVDGVRYWHASPVSDVIGLAPEPAPGEAALLAQVRERRLVVGHTHLPFRRATEHGVELINPGSVGMPFDGDARAAYALVGEDSFPVEQRRIPYDHLASAAAVRERLGTAGELIARRIEQARIDPQMD